MPEILTPPPELTDDIAAGLTLPRGLVADLLVLIRRADSLLLEYYNKAGPLAVERKGDQSPVTEADHASHRLLHAGLTGLTPEIPVLSEESSEAAVSGRGDWDTCWVVDPLDGTKEFIGRTDEFTINIALVHAGRPVLGLISVPVTGRCYLGIPGMGAWRCEADDYHRCQALEPAAINPDAPLRVLASKRHNPEKVRHVMEQLKGVAAGVQRVDAGSALKFCALAEGAADVYPRTSPCYEWDVAAGEALVLGVGGYLVDQWGESLRYNQRDTLLVEHFVASVDSGVDWVELLR